MGIFQSTFKPLEIESPSEVQLHGAGRVRRTSGTGPRINATWRVLGHQLRSFGKAAIVTSQLPIEHWYGWTIADAMLDRLMHRHHRIKLTGDSLRKPPPKSTVLEPELDQNTEELFNRNGATPNLAESVTCPNLAVTLTGIRESALFCALRRGERNEFAPHVHRLEAHKTAVFHGAFGALRAAIDQPVSTCWRLEPDDTIIRLWRVAYTRGE